MSNSERNKRRLRKYNMLIQAGYTAKEATKYKNLSNYKVTELLKLKEKFKPIFDREFLEFENEKNKILKGKSYE